MAFWHPPGRTPLYAPARSSLRAQRLVRNGAVLLARPLVVHAEELDYGLNIIGAIHPPTHPTRVGQRRMYRGPPLGYELVADFLGEGQVCKAGAVQVPELHPTVTELQSAPSGVAGGDTRPALHLALDLGQRFIVHWIFSFRCPRLLSWLPVRLFASCSSTVLGPYFGTGCASSIVRAV